MQGDRGDHVSLKKQIQEGRQGRPCISEETISGNGDSSRSLNDRGKMQWRTKGSAWADRVVGGVLRRAWDLMCLRTRWYGCVQGGHFLIPPVLHVVVLVLSVCANAHMWSSKENFGERIHYKLLGSKSGHQPCNASTFSPSVILISPNASVLSLKMAPNKHATTLWRIVSQFSSEIQLSRVLL